MLIFAFVKKSIPLHKIAFSLIAVLCFCFITLPSYCQEQKASRRAHLLDSLAAIEYPSLAYPRNPESGKIVWGLDLDVTIAPRQVVREEVRQVPQLACIIRIGLPAGFGVGVRLAGNYIANQLSLIP